jgi:hypothetical protein
MEDQDQFCDTARATVLRFGHASISDIARAARVKLDRAGLRAVLNQMVTRGELVRAGHDLYGLPQRRAVAVPGLSYVTDLALAPVERLMGARA